MPQGHRLKQRTSADRDLLDSIFKSSNSKSLFFDIDAQRHTHDRQFSVAKHREISATIGEDETNKAGITILTCLLTPILPVTVDPARAVLPGFGR
jgi:hypothetical protein